MKNIVLRKIIGLTVISVLCLIVGIAYMVSQGDKTLIIMSIIICSVNMYKIWDIRQIEKTNKFFVIKGVCIEAPYTLVGKYRLYKIQTGDDVVEISVPKSVKLKIHNEYKLYFKVSRVDMAMQVEWIKNKILSENFLGYESVNCTE